MMQEIPYQDTSFCGFDLEGVTVVNALYILEHVETQTQSFLLLFQTATDMIFIFVTIHKYESTPYQTSAFAV